MASIRKKARSPYWYACFALPDGARTQRSTKTPDRKKALRMANYFEDAARMRATEGQARRILSDIHELAHGSPLDTATYSQYLTQWLARKKNETVAVTLKAYEHALSEFEAHLGSVANGQMQYITTRHISSWRDQAAARASNRTANNKLKILRTLFQSARNDGLISDNPAAKVTALKTKDSTRRPFTIPEIQSVLSFANREWQGMILVGFYTGQRLKDIARLTWANIDLQKNELRFVTSKTSRRQLIPLASPVVAYLNQIPVGDNPNQPIFPDAFEIASRNRDTSALSRQFHGILVLAGLANEREIIRDGSGDGRGAPRQQNDITFHSLRHTATSLLKATGATEAVARDIIGHESEEISRHYTHVEPAAKREAISKFPDLLNHNTNTPEP